LVNHIKKLCLSESNLFTVLSASNVQWVPGMEVYKYYDVLSVNFPQALHIKNKCKTKRKRAAQIVSLHRSASAELEINAMKGRSIYGGNDLRFDTNRMIEARENNSSTLKEVVIDPAVKRALSIRAGDIKAILIKAYPDQKKDINKTKMKIGDSDPDDYVTLVDMIVELWKVQDSATLEANT